MIKINNLAKKYGKKVVYDNVNIEIEQGVIYGFVGYNGAGKSTLFKMISGISCIDSGTINNSFVGLEFIDDKASLLGITINDMYNYYNTLYQNFDSTVFNDKLKSLNLTLDNQIVELSKGQKSLVRLYFAICSDAKLILIDEIFDGLDAVNRELITNEMISDETKDRTYVVIDHNLHDLEKLCEKFLYVSHTNVNVLDDPTLIYENHFSINSWFKEEL
jgi:ABC-2 type transport system ATP-binding protein